MSIDLGIRAAVRAATERESDYWLANLPGFMALNLDRTPAGAFLRNSSNGADSHDAYQMLTLVRRRHFDQLRLRRRIIEKAKL